MSLLLWMVYALVVGIVVGGAAWLLDRALTVLRRPTRWVWLGAMVLAVALPLVGLPGNPSEPAFSGVRDIHPEEVSAPAADYDAGWAAPFARVAAEVERGMAAAVSRGASYLPPSLPLSTVLAAGWILGTLLLVGLGSVATIVLSRQRAHWPRARIQDREVRVSPKLGPAVVGLVRPEVILPSWTLSLPRREMEMILAHEGQHVAAQDTRVLAAGSLIAAAMPWSPGLWWMLARLRGSVELDCDRRVLAQGVSPRAYGSLLLTVGSARRGSPLPAAALTHPANLLERRLVQMKNSRVRHPLLMGGALAAIALLTLTVACEMQTPIEADLTSEAAEVTATASTPSAQSAPEGDRGIFEGGRVDLDAGPLVFVDGARIGHASPTGTGDAYEASSSADGEGRRILSELNPNQIERIDVLHGEAAQRLYLEEGKNGVIRIYTRSDDG